MAQIVLENRYMVFKNTDIEAFCTQEQKDQLKEIFVHLNESRTSNLKGPLTGIFIEGDWPIYQLTVNLLDIQVKNASILGNQNFKIEADPGIHHWIVEPNEDHRYKVHQTVTFAFQSQAELFQFAAQQGNWQMTRTSI